MTKQEFVTILQRSNRWGVNNQPPLEDVVNTLLQLPIEEVVVTRDDTIEFITFRPLTAREAFRLARLDFSFPDEIEDNQTCFKLWWD